MDARLPIAVFDSGMGGVGVLRALRALLPRENYLYFGDSANAPYGVRPYDEILALSRAAVAHLVGEGTKALVVGCNTVTSVAVKTLRAENPGLIIVATEPDIQDNFLFENAKIEARSRIINQFSRDIVISSAHLGPSELHRAITDFLLRHYLDTL